MGDTKEIISEIIILVSYIYYRPPRQNWNTRKWLYLLEVAGVLLAIIVMNDGYISCYFSLVILFNLIAEQVDSIRKRRMIDGSAAKGYNREKRWEVGK